MNHSASARDQDSENEASSGAPVWVKILAVIAFLASLAMVIVLFYRGGRRQGGATTEIEHRLELTRAALASTENLESAEADTLWSQLHAEQPQDAAVAINRAINRILRLDELSAQATNASLDEAVKKAARSQLPDVIATARQAVQDCESDPDQVVAAAWFQSRIDLHEASLMPGSLTKTLRREVYQRLAGAINGPLGKTPRGIMLGGSLLQVLDQLEDPIDGLPNDLLEDAEKTVAALSDLYDDNIYFALRAARLRIAGKDPDAVVYVRRANALAAPIEPSIRRETEPIGVTPDQLVQQIIDAIESGKWSDAENRMLLWFNVLNSTEIVKTDRRRATPHPLDLLNFESLRRLSAEIVAASPLKVAETEWNFASTALADSGEVRSQLAIDFDLDLDPDLVTLHPDNQIQLWSNDGSGQFQSVGRLQLPIDCTGMIAADLFLVDSSNPSRLRSDRRADSNAQPAAESDLGSAVRHDTFASLLAFGPGGLQMVQVDGRTSADDGSRLQLVATETGLEEVRDVLTAIAGDLEADGDLDLVVSTRADGIRMFANRGNRSFFELPRLADGFGIDDPVSAMAIADLDRDLDLDVITVHPASGRVALLENLLHLQFRARYLTETGSLPEADVVFVEDVDGNVSWDLIVGGKGIAIVYSQTADAGAWTVERTELSDHDGSELALADLDNDSWLDLIVPAGDHVEISRIGPWGFMPWSNVGVESGNSPIVVADLNRDGAIDLVTRGEASSTVRLNQTPDIGHHLDVRFKGIDDNVSGRVNHYAIGSVLELRFGPHYRARIVTSPSTHFGLDGYATASSVRAILPNGLTQTVRDPKIDSLLEEEQTLKGSCPYLYAWDGEKFVFKTDCLWAAPLGLQVAWGVVARDRPWEYLKIDGSDVRPSGDHYEFRITEELWEVAYFDKVAMSVVDHPAEVEVWTNEKVGPAEIAMPTIFAFESSHLRTAKSASDTTGRDVTEQLAEADRNFVQAFDRRLRQGLCSPHWIDLDFGQLDSLSLDSDTSDGGLSTFANHDAAKSKVYLVLTGWILPTDTSLNIQIDQNPELGPIEFPSVWVPDDSQADGWRKAIPNMGFPGGKTKTIVVDVSDVINRRDARLRIRTSAQIYWDCARVVAVSEPARFQEHPLSLVGAEVVFHGFSERLRDDVTKPETYDYQRVSEQPRWPPLRGGLTRFGDCLELVRQWDDSMVVMGAGDEIRLKFSLPAAPLPAGWNRDFVIHSVGWDKDADLNTLAGQSTGPLPYREMTGYPPPASELAKSAVVESRNQSHRQREQAFRSFWYRAEPN